MLRARSYTTHTEVEALYERDTREAIRECHVVECISAVASSPTWLLYAACGSDMLDSQDRGVRARTRS